jgi:transcriptional regulator with XRE-family HTH domain
MARPLIGRTIRRLRMERGLTQQALAARLGISASYLNLIEHDQRSVTASLLIKLGEHLAVDLATLSGNREKHAEAGLREVLSDPLLGLEEVPEQEVPLSKGQGCKRSCMNFMRTPTSKQP